jgi:predicted dehydrogenase
MSLSKPVPRAVSDPTPIGVAVIGAGYWGPNLIRNFNASDECDLRWVCDIDIDRARKAVGKRSTVGITTSLDAVLDDDDVHAVAIATPAATHGELGMVGLEAGRHVLMEKPLAASVGEGEKLVAAAHSRGLVLMCDHTYCYTPAVRRIRELIDTGALGEIQYIDCVRINLGLVQPDIDVIWDLAPHDLSILDFILPANNTPQAVAAHGADPLGAGRASLAYLTLPLGGRAIAHAHVNWLSPTKVRNMVIGGSKRMLVWDDLHPTQRLSLYDRGIEVGVAMDDEQRRSKLVSYRIGDVVSPALPEYEALGAVVTEFAAAIRQKRAPATDARAGLRVLRILEAASASLHDSGMPVPLESYWK